MTGTEKYANPDNRLCRNKCDIYNDAEQERSSVHSRYPCLMIMIVFHYDGIFKKPPDALQKGCNK